jgi:hypothetical protein
VPVPSYTTIVGDLGDKKVYLLKDEILSEQDFLHDNFNYSPSTSLLSETGSSPTSSVYYSDYSEDIRIDSSFGDGNTSNGFDTYMDDIVSVPENIYQLLGLEEESIYNNFHHTSVIAKNIPEKAIITESSMLADNYQELNISFISNYDMGNNLSRIKVSEEINRDQSVTNYDTSGTSDSGDDDEDMRKGFDIEILVEECFRQIEEGVEQGKF